MPAHCPVGDTAVIESPSSYMRDRLSHSSRIPRQRGRAGRVLARVTNGA